MHFQFGYHLPLFPLRTTKIFDPLMVLYLAGAVKLLNHVHLITGHTRELLTEFHCVGIALVE